MMLQDDAGTATQVVAIHHRSRYKWQWLPGASDSHHVHYPRGL